MKNSLELGLIGNCRIGALIDGRGEIVWSCLPRFDGDPVFCSLLHEHADGESAGYCAIELLDQVEARQSYLPNTAVLITCLTDRHGGSIEVTDFAPRFHQYGRTFMPMMMIRQIRRVSGNPRICLRVRPLCEYGGQNCTITHGSHHIRYVAPSWILRLTTDVSVTAVLQELPFFLETTATLILGPDETIPDAIGELSRRFLDETIASWRDWVRDLSIPFEWQEEVIRAAITLKLNTFQDTGAIIAAMTTSIPEAPGSGRNWDYRYCWLRDSYFVVNALNRLSTTNTMERYLNYLINVAAGTPNGRIQPVYGIDGKARLDECEVASLPGYRGMGPVRVGNQACEQIQHDVYGSAILAVAHVFFDRRLAHRGGVALFTRLEPLGEAAIAVHDQPDSGPWETRNTLRVHYFFQHHVLGGLRSSGQNRFLYWACGSRRLLAEPGRSDPCHDLPARLEQKKQSFAASFDGDSLDASLLLLHDLGFLPADDPRFAGTVAAIERELKHGNYIYRYVETDDFGVPENAFVVCTFWYIYALVALNRVDEARELFGHLLSRRNRHGLLAEHIDPRTGEPWGNFVQTYSMVGLINSAIRLSKRWDSAF